MVKITASCPTCGEVPLHQDDLSLYTDGTYAFDCPKCGELVEKVAGDRIVRLLGSVGIHPRDRNPLTPDDLINFMAALAQTDNLAEYV